MLCCAARCLRNDDFLGCISKLHANHHNDQLDCEFQKTAILGTFLGAQTKKCGPIPRPSDKLALRVRNTKSDLFQQTWMTIDAFSFSGVTQ